MIGRVDSCQSSRHGFYVKMGIAESEHSDSCDAFLTCVIALAAGL